MQCVLLRVDHVLRAQRLVTVLAAAHVEEVVLVGVDALAERGARQLEADSAPLAAETQQLHVAAVRVDVHELRIERADAKLHTASSIATVLPTHSAVSGIQPRSRAR